MSSGGAANVEIRITGALDPSVAGSTAAAAAEIDKLAVQAEKTSKTVKGAFSRETIDGALGIGKAANSAEQSLLGMGLAAADQKEKLASAFGKGAEEAEHLALGTTRARTEIIVLAHEMVQGRFTRIPGSLMVLAESMGGVGLAAMGMGAAVLAAVGGVAYMAYQSLEAEKNLDHLAEGFALTGRGAEISKQAIAYNLDFLAKLPGATKDATQGFVEFVAQHANVSAVLANEVGQLLPAFIDLYGKEAPAAAGKLTETLSELTIEGFQKLDRELLNLNPQQYETITNLIETGHQAEAVSAILKQLSLNSGIYIKSLGDQVYDVKQQIDGIKAAMKGETDDAQIGRDYAELDRLEKKLASIRQLEAKQGQQEANNRIKAEIDDINKANNGLDRREAITNRIAVLERETANARKRGDTDIADKGDSAIAAEQAKITALDKQAIDERYRNDLTGLQARAALYKEGSAQQQAILRQELAVAKSTYGEQSTQALQVQAKINAGVRAAAQERDQLAKQESREAEQEMKRYAAEYVQIARDNLHTALSISKIELDAKRQDLDRQVQDHEITAQQKRQILESLAREVAAFDIEELQYELTTNEQGTLAYQRAANQIKIIEAQLQKDLAAIRRDAAAEQRTQDKQRTQSYRSMISEITQAEGGLIRNIFHGQLGLTQSLIQLGENLLERELEQDAEYYTTQLLYKNLGLAADERSAQGGVLVHLLAEGQKTAGTVAGETARVAAKEAGAVAGSAVDIASGSASILNDAYKAAAGAYSAVAGIPIIGPVLAPVAAATAFTAVAAFDALTSFDVGTNYVPRNMVAKIHEGERIIPKADNAALMEAVEGNSRGGGGGGDVHIHAMDSRDVMRVLRSNPQAVAAALRSMRQKLVKV